MDVMVDNAEFVGNKGESGGGQGGYQNNGGNYRNNNYQAPPQQAAPAAAAPNNDNMSYGALSDFEEILSDGDVPF